MRRGWLALHNAVVTENAGVRVATLNVLGPANPRWDQRRQLIGNTLRATAADVVALQEVPIVSAPEVVDDLLGGGYHVTGFAEAADDGVGGALATRWPHVVIDKIDQRRTPRSADFPWCSTLLVATDSPAGRLLIVHHKPSWQFGYEYEREQQAVAAARVIEARGDDVDHVIVLGDFDAPTGRREHAVLAWSAFAGRIQCLLPRRVGDGPASGAWLHL